MRHVDEPVPNAPTVSASHWKAVPEAFIEDGRLSPTDVAVGLALRGIMHEDRGFPKFTRSKHWDAHSIPSVVARMVWPKGKRVAKHVNRHFDRLEESGWFTFQRQESSGTVIAFNFGDRGTLYKMGFDAEADFVRVPKAVLCDPTLRPIEKRLYAGLARIESLANRVDRFEWFALRQAQLLKRSGISNRETLRSGLEVLESRRLIDIEDLADVTTEGSRLVRLVPLEIAYCRYSPRLLDGNISVAAYRSLGLPQYEPHPHPDQRYELWKSTGQFPPGEMVEQRDGGRLTWHFPEPEVVEIGAIIDLRSYEGLQARVRARQRVARQRAHRRRLGA